MKKAFRPLALCLGFCLLLGACAAGGTEEKTPVEKPSEQPTQNVSAPSARDASTLVIALQDEVTGLDVQQIAWENMVHDLIFEPLVVYNSDLSEIYPSFAESFTATDEYLEFVLPEGAKFCNGDPLDAAAVKASAERFLQISEYASDLEPVTGVEVVDERTVRYNLSEPAPYIWANLASMYGGIVDVAAAEQMGDFEFNKRPVGNGMYSVSEWVAGSHITLKRNEYFHTNNPMLQNHDAPPFETIVVRFIPDDEARLNELAEGHVDLIYNAPTAQKEMLESGGQYNIYSYQQPGVSYLNLQTKSGPLADERVRQALTYAVDRDAINAALGGIITPSYGFISAAQAGYSAEEEAKLSVDLACDVARAKALLAEAGWKDTDGDGILNKAGESLTVEMLIPSDNTTFRAAGPVLREQFAAIGVDAQIVEYESDYIKELMRSDDYTIGSRALKWVDADILYYAFTPESGYPWEDPTLTRLITAARYADDRVEAYAAMSERLAQDFKAISLFADNYIIVSRAGVDGIVVTSDGRAWYNDVVKSETSQ